MLTTRGSSLDMSLPDPPSKPVLQSPTAQAIEGLPLAESQEVRKDEWHGQRLGLSDRNNEEIHCIMPKLRAQQGAMRLENLSENNMDLA